MDPVRLLIQWPEREVNFCGCMWGCEVKYEWHQSAGTEFRMQVMSPRTFGVAVSVSVCLVGCFVFELLSCNWRLRPHQVIPDLAGTKEVKRRGNIRHPNTGPVISQSLKSLPINWAKLPTALTKLSFFLSFFSTLTFTSKLEIGSDLWRRVKFVLVVLMIACIIIILVLISQLLLQSLALLLSRSQMNEPT